MRGEVPQPGPVDPAPAQVQVDQLGKACRSGRGGSGQGRVGQPPTHRAGSRRTPRQCAGERRHPQTQSRTHHAAPHVQRGGGGRAGWVDYPRCPARAKGRGRGSRLVGWLAGLPLRCARSSSASIGQCVRSRVVTWQRRPAASSAPARTYLHQAGRLRGHGHAGREAGAKTARLTKTGGSAAEGGGVPRLHRVPRHPEAGEEPGRRQTAAGEATGTFGI